jgi:hypothetical protein
VMDWSMFLAFAAPNYLSHGLQSFAMAVTVADGPSLQLSLAPTPVQQCL